MTDARTGSTGCSSNGEYATHIAAVYATGRSARNRANAASSSAYEPCRYMRSRSATDRVNTSSACSATLRAGLRELELQAA
jgi:hypothetical protein